MKDEHILRDNDPTVVVTDGEGEQKKVKVMPLPGQLLVAGGTLELPATADPKDPTSWGSEGAEINRLRARNANLVFMPRGNEWLIIKSAFGFQGILGDWELLQNLMHRAAWWRVEMLVGV